MTIRRIRATAAALLAAAAVAVLVVAFLGRGDITVSAPVLVGDIGAVTVNNSPTVVRNPQNPANLVVANRVDRPGFSAAVNASTDGGQTWTTAIPPLPPDLDRPFGPNAAFDANGKLYVTYVNLEGSGNTPSNLWLATSNNGGRTFSDPMKITDQHAFQARLVVDPDTSVLYATWLRADQLGTLSFPGRPVILASRSEDGGQTWSDPVQVSDASRARVGAAVPVLTGRGELVVVYEDFKDDRRDFQNLEGPPWDQPFAFVVTRSTDDGASFSDGVEFDSQVQPLRRFLPYLPAFPGVATSGQDGISVVWADGRNGDLDVFLRRSSDAGRSWDEPARVNGNPLGDGTSQYLPAIDIADNGRVDVAYLDRRDDPTDVMMRASLATSMPGSSNFRSLVLSPTSFDSRVGATASARLEVDFGTRLGLDSRNDGVLAAWPDTTLGTQTSGRQDVATRRVHFPTPAIPVSRGVLYAALLLLAGAAVLLLHRRRPAPSDDAQE